MRTAALPSRPHPAAPPLRPVPEPSRAGGTCQTAATAETTARPAAPSLRRRCPRTQPRGLALLLVLWALIVLTLVIFTLIQQLNRQFVLDTRDNRVSEAHALAFSGLEIALHPGITNNQPEVLRRRFDANRRYEVQLQGEGGKLNLNWLVSGDNPRKQDILRQYLQTRGLTYSEVQVFVDCLADYVSPGDLRHLNGSEVDLDGKPVPHRPLQDLKELFRIKGTEPLLTQPDWDRDFTLLSQGRVDLQWASATVIAALPGVGAAQAEAFVEARRGADKLDGTADDLVLDDFNKAAGALGMAPSQFQQQLGEFVVLREGTTRIVSRGFSGDVTRTIEAVVVKTANGGGEPRFLLKREY